MARTLLQQHLYGAPQNGVLVPFHEKGQHGAELLPGIGPGRAGLRLPGDEDPRACRDGEARQLRHLHGGLADHLGIDGAVRTQEQLGNGTGLLGVEEIGTLAAEFLPDFVGTAFLRDDALLRGADRTVVKGLGAQNVGDGLRNVCRAVDIGRAVARTHTDGRFSRGIGRPDHGRTAGGQDQLRVLMMHQLLHRLHGGDGNAADGALRRTGRPCSLLQQSGGLHRAADGLGMGRKDDGAACLQGNEGFVDDCGGGVGGWDDARDNAHGNAHVPDPALPVFPEDAHGLHAADGTVDRLGGKTVFDLLVLRVAKARFLYGHAAQFGSVAASGLGDGLYDPIQPCLIEAPQLLKGRLGLIDELPRLLPGA